MGKPTESHWKPIALRMHASGKPFETICRTISIQQKIVASWLGIPIPTRVAVIPVVPYASKPVYRVLSNPIARKRKAGGWRAKGEVLLRTKSNLEALVLCGETNNSCVVQNHGVVLSYNNVRGIRYAAAPQIGGFRFGRATE